MWGWKGRGSSLREEVGGDRLVSSSFSHDGLGWRLLLIIKALLCDTLKCDSRGCVKEEKWYSEARCIHLLVSLKLTLFCSVQPFTHILSLFSNGGALFSFSFFFHGKKICGVLSSPASWQVTVCHKLIFNDNATCLSNAAQTRSPKSCLTLLPSLTPTSLSACSHFF